MKVLVTGAGGFIGSNLVRFLVAKREYQVTALDFRFPEDRMKLLDGAEKIFCDLRSPGAIDAVIGAEKYDFIYHLASNMGGVGFFTSNDYRPFIDNMTMDIAVLEACEKHGVNRLFYASSACVYPTHIQMTQGEAPALSEDMIYPANADLSYGWEKLMMLRLCERAPLDARVGIFHTIYGPYQESSGARMKAPTALATKAIKSLETGKMEIWGNGEQIRSFLYIDDAVEMIYRVMERAEYFGPVNIGSNEAVTMKEVAQICVDVVGSQPNFTFTDDKPSGVLARNCDSTKFQKHYGYFPMVDAREGFARLINWLQEERSV